VILTLLNHRLIANQAADAKGTAANLTVFYTVSTHFQIALNAGDKFSRKLLAGTTTRGARRINKSGPMLVSKRNEMFSKNLH
jgi:hypothetical protein